MANENNNFVFLVKICMIDNLFKYLSSCELYRYNNFYRQHDRIHKCESEHVSDDIIQLMRCCKEIKNLVKVRLIGKVEFALSVVNKWNHEQKYRVRHLFIDEDSEFINDQMLPCLTHLRFSWVSKVQCNIPKTLTRLEFGGGLDKIITQDMLPESLKYLTFGYLWNQKLMKNVLPVNLTYLEFGKCFNKPLEKGVLPEKLEYLILGRCFDQPLDKIILPENLTFLRFGREFKQVLDTNIFPKKLTHLKFGIYFNNPLIDSNGQNVLPDGLKYLQLGSQYTQPFFGLDGECVLPKSLTALNIGKRLSELLDDF